VYHYISLQQCMSLVMIGEVVAESGDASPWPWIVSEMTYNVSSGMLNPT